MAFIPSILKLMNFSVHYSLLKAAICDVTGINWVSSQVTYLAYLWSIGEDKFNVILWLFRFFLTSISLRGINILIFPSFSIFNCAWAIAARARYICGAYEEEAVKVDFEA